MRKYLVAAACAVVGTLTIAGAAFGYQVITTDNGTWTAHPGQSTTYQAAVQQPIDTANTSNWTLKSKGAIPIMFKLSSGTGPFLFQSIFSNNPGVTADDYSFLEFDPFTPPTLAEISTLIANYTFTDGDCAVGSLRWTLYLDDQGTTRNLDVHYQPGAGGVSTQSCAPGTSGANMADTTSTDPYVVIQEFNHAPYSFSSSYNVTYDEAVDQLGDLSVLGMNLILESGYGVNGDQVVDLDSATVGVADGTTYTETFTPQASSAFAQTCDLPEATLRVTRKDPTPDGAVNEEPVQAPLVDTGDTFRTVDCKYMYNLSIPSLKTTGPGTYQIEILINGTPVPTPGSLNGKVLIDVRG